MRKVAMVEKVLVVGICLLGMLLVAEDAPRIWWQRYHQGSDSIYFIEDKETGTRCYAITNGTVNMSGYAISCVPKK